MEPLARGAGNIGSGQIGQAATMRIGGAQVGQVGDHGDVVSGDASVDVSPSVIPISEKRPLLGGVKCIFGKPESTAQKEDTLLGGVVCQIAANGRTFPEMESASSELPARMNDRRVP